MLDGLLGEIKYYAIRTELTEVVRQNDQLFINLLNKVRVGNIDDDV